MNYVKFTDNSVKVKGAIKEKCLKALVEVSSLLVSQTIKNSRRDSGQLRNSWNFIINEGKLESTIGSDDENSIWEEFGTGEYALNGDGRSVWYVPVSKVKGRKKPTYKGKVIIIHTKDGAKFYKTNGKKPTRAFYNAFSSLKNQIIAQIKQVLGEIK